MIWLRAIGRATPYWLFTHLAFPVAFFLDMKPMTFKETVLYAKRGIEGGRHD